MHNMYNRWRWTAITVFCFNRNMICKDCPEFNSCAMGENGRIAKKEYGLKNVKEAVLATYAHLGKPDKKKWRE